MTNPVKAVHSWSLFRTLGSYVAAGAMPITWLAVLGEWQRDWARENTAAGVSAVILEHGGASAVALAWELQLLATRAKASA